MKTRHEILYRNIKLEVVGYYYKGSNQTWEQPSDPQEFEIHEVWHNGGNISDLFNDYHELESITLEEHYI